MRTSNRTTAVTLVSVLIAASSCGKTYGEHERRAKAEPTANVDPKEPEGNDASTPSAPDASTAPKVETYVDAPDDAEGAGLDVADTTVQIDASGILKFRVAMPGAARSTPVVTDNFQLYVDADADASTGTNGYEYRLVLFGDGTPQFQLQRWEGRWMNRTPTSFSASFSDGIDIRVNASDLGIASSFDFSIITVDGTTGRNSDFAPDGALTDRWTYTK